MAEAGSAFVSLLPSAKGFGRATEKQISGEMGTAGKNVGSKFGTAMKVGALAVVGGAVALGGFLKGSIDEAREAQKVGALTNAVIKSTGGVANVTAKQVDSLATSISNKTGVDDESIAAGENMLLTFSNVRNELGKGNDIFNQATVAATDMAAAFGGDATSNSKMLGKALNDPTAGVSALTRVGVSFTQQQKDQIKALQESGNMLGAQKIILGEVSKQTKGAAASQATAGQKFTTIWANFKESIDTALLPTVDRIFTALSRVVLFLQANMGPAFRRIGEVVGPAFATARDAVMGVFDSLSGGSGVLSKVLPPILALANSIRANFLPVLQTMANTFLTVILPAATSLVSYLASKLYPVFAQVAAIITTKVVPIVASLAAFFYGTLYPAVVRIVTAIAGSLKPVFDQLVATFQAKVLPAISSLLAKFREWQPTIQRVIVVVVKIVGAVLRLAAAILGKVLPPLIRFAGFLIGLVFSAIGKVIGIVVRIIKFILDLGGAITKAVGFVRNFASTLVDLERRGLDAVLDAVTSLPGKIMALGGRFLSAGKALIGKFVEGLRGAGSLVSDIAGNVWDAVKGLLNSAIGKINSALEFTIHLPGPDISINPPNIPALANGGVVSSATLALIGEGSEREAVMPLSKLSSMLDRERAAASATGNGRGGGRAALTITNWDEGTGYMEWVADGRINGHADLAGQRARAM